MILGEGHDRSAFESGDDITTGLEKAWAGVVFTLLFFLLIVPTIIAIGAIISTIAGGTPDGILIAFLSLTCAGLGATVFPMLGSSVAIGIVVGINWTFSDFLRQRTAVVIFGSLSGFLSTFWLTLIWGNFSAIEPLIVSSLFIVLAMIAGYLGGIVSTSRKGVWKHQVKSDEDKFQFKIKHIFVLTFWACFVLAFDRLVGSHRVLILFGLYAVVQGAILLADAKIRSWRKYLRFIPGFGKRRVEVLR